jgi:hypothetical protein
VGTTSPAIIAATPHVKSRQYLKPLVNALCAEKENAKPVTQTLSEHKEKA